MSELKNGNYCMQCDANGDDDYNDAYKYVNDMNQLRDTVIGYGKIWTSSIYEELMISVPMVQFKF